MKKIATLMVLVVTLMMSTSMCSATQYVHGYYRSNGTYVGGHYRSDSNGTTIDNWSHHGNTNPYTGSRGYRYD